MGSGDHILPAPDSFTHAVTVTGPQQTFALGQRMAGLLAGGEIILLYGNLGAGKTCLVQGICAGLQVVQEVVSPTFTLVNTYAGRLTVHHLDFYRVEPRHDLADIGVPDLLDEIWDGAAVGLVEWPGPLVNALGDVPYLELLAVVGARPDDRVWHLRGRPDLPPAWARILSPKEPPSC
jgi:tRNA threonylcarbamoyladenosine biosynthesis protein TsaE